MKNQNSRVLFPSFSPQGGASSRDRFRDNLRMLPVAANWVTRIVIIIYLPSCFNQSNSFSFPFNSCIWFIFISTVQLLAHRLQTNAIFQSYNARLINNRDYWKTSGYTRIWTPDSPIQLVLYLHQPPSQLCRFSADKLPCLELLARALGGFFINVDFWETFLVLYMTTQPLVIGSNR